MGNSTSDVAAGVRAQANSDGAGPELYNYVTLSRNTDLIAITRKAQRTKDFTEVDNIIENEVCRFLYKDGKKQKVELERILEFKNGPHFRRLAMKNEKSRTDCDARIPYSSREICWDIDHVGPVGENILHLCILLGKSVHLEIAKRLLKTYPDLINDIYLGDEYFGENLLHIAIVNEDPVIVKYLLDNGANVKQRASGIFFTPTDQRKRKQISLTQEEYVLPINTDYDGLGYFGEYPLSFAACLNQEECIRLLLAKGANPDAQDSNGNTVLHMMVIKDNREMFTLCYELGAKIDIKNNAGLTPLMLAARLAKMHMFKLILEIIREVYWTFGNVVCVAYPLTEIDTINSIDGHSEDKNVLNQIVHSSTIDHLELLEGPVLELLEEKWRKFIRPNFYKNLILFSLFYCCLLTSIALRPTPCSCTPFMNNTLQNMNFDIVHCNDDRMGKCYLRRINNCTEELQQKEYVRIVFELITLICSIIIIILAIIEIHRDGFHNYLSTYAIEPTKAMYNLSAILIAVVCLLLRCICQSDAENVFMVAAAIIGTPYFLFFCRGFKMVGPFVVMIYEMIKTDLLRFFIIYTVFIMGFSQALFVIFIGTNFNIFSTGIEGVLGVFYMSQGQFFDTYATTFKSKHQYLGIFFYILYMALSPILLINMLIAMMGNTYSVINEREREWLRQWGKMVLLVERTVSHKSRLAAQKKYAQETKNNVASLVMRWKSTDNEMERIHEKRLEKIEELMEQPVKVKNNPFIISNNQNKQTNPTITIK
ncbi:hypothetical protein SNEBB_005561 [Seison nebaliae]|nr:hypothetical protein SNEBB_005561 [Seison nebaliae]